MGIGMGRLQFALFMFHCGGGEGSLCSHNNYYSSHLTALYPGFQEDREGVIFVLYDYYI